MIFQKEPKFSIILPTYNRANLIQQAISSVCDQTYSDWELLIIDNHSSDGTREILEKYIDPRIRIFKIQNNGSISASRNLGVSKARGEWIAFLDSDDWWERNKLESCNAYTISSVDFIYHDLHVVSKNMAAQPLLCRQLTSPVLTDLLLRGNPIAASSVVVRKSIFLKAGPMDEDLTLVTTADYKMWLAISRFTNSFLHLNQKLGSYRIHASNVSTHYITAATLGAMVNYLPLLTESQERHAIENLHFAQAKVWYSSGNLVTALKDLLRLIRYGRILVKIKSLILIFQVSLKMLILSFSKIFHSNVFTIKRSDV